MKGDREPAAAIQHVALEIEPREVERARRFWLLVGFEAVDPPATLSERAVWFEAGPPGARTQIHLLFAEADAQGGVGAPPVGTVGESSRSRPRAGGHVAVVVPDFDPTVAQLRRTGFQVEDRRPHWGAPRAFAAHPGGHTVELMAAPPSSRAAGDNHEKRGTG